MLPTPPLRSLKGMLPRIHHPLPLNAKSTKKLLDTLTTSFRKNLDREHGWLDEDAATAKAVTAKTADAADTGRHKDKDTGGAVRSSASVTSLGKANAIYSKKPSSGYHQPTDRHLRAILSNPLFSYDQTVAAAAAAKQPPIGVGIGVGVTNGAAVAAATATATSVERDPMEIFDWAVARGMMTPKRALGCLLAKKREAVQSSHVSSKAAMNASGAGRKVVQWLRASGLERDLSFVADEHLTSVLVQFLAADAALEELVWLWIARLQRGEGPAFIGRTDQPHGGNGRGRHPPVAAASFLLDRLVKAKIMGAATLDDAYRAMARGADLFDKTTPAFDGNVFWPWCYLSWKSTFTTFAALDMARATPRLYEAFVAIMDHDDRPSIRLERAHLDLRHPTHPTPARAVALLADDHLLRDVQASASTAEPPPGKRPGYPNRIVSMGLDAVRHLAYIGESDEAQRIFNRLRDQFGAHLDQLQMHT